MLVIDCQKYLAQAKVDYDIQTDDVKTLNDKAMILLEIQTAKMNITEEVNKINSDTDTSTLKTLDEVKKMYDEELKQAIEMKKDEYSEISSTNQVFLQFVNNYAQFMLDIYLHEKIKVKTLEKDEEDKAIRKLKEEKKGEKFEV